MNKQYGTWNEFPAKYGTKLPKTRNTLRNFPKNMGMLENYEIF